MTVKIMFIKTDPTNKQNTPFNVFAYFQIKGVII